MDTGEFVVVDGRKNGVHATPGGDDGNIGSSAAEVGHHDDLILNSRLGTRVVGKNRGNGLGDELEDLKTSVASSLDEDLAGLFIEVGGDGDYGGGDGLAKVLGGSGNKSLEVSRSNLGYGNGRWLLGILVLDGEGDTVLVLRVGGSMAVGGVDRLEAIKGNSKSARVRSPEFEKESIECARNPYSWPKKSLK